MESENIKPGFKKFSFWVPWIFFLVCLLMANIEKLPYKTSNALLHWDGAGYYAYLPAFFIYEDASFKFHKMVSGVPQDEFLKRVDTLSVNKYAGGTAILLAPFFLSAHAWAQIAEAPADGYSTPYRWGILIGTAFYAALGLFFIRLIIGRLFPDYVVVLTLITLGFGTNLFYYSTYEGMMSHSFSFFLFALVIWLGMKWKENFDGKYLLWIALVGGMIAATRLTNSIILIVPMLWGVRNFQDLALHLKKIFAQPVLLVFGILLFVLPSIPYLLYIKSQTGHFFFDTYHGERFFWNDPLIFKVLFSYRKGWLVWSPLIVLGFIGWIFGRKHPAFWGVSIFMLLNLYVISSWWCWWYGGGFGMRALIEASVPLSIGIAFSIHTICKRKAGSYIFAVVFPWFIALNFLQTHQYFRGIIHYDAMTKKAYWEVFGLVHPVSEKIMTRRNEFLHYTDPAKTLADEAYRRSL